MSETIDNRTEEEKFKASPLGFLMSVIAKHQAYMQKTYETSGNKSALENAKKASDMMDNLKIELSKTENLKKEKSNEAVMMHVVENCTKDEQEIILSCVFEYLNLVDGAIQNLEKDSEEYKDAVDEYYNVSRLGLLLNCYLGEFNNDDFFYGTLAEMADDAKFPDLSNKLITAIEKADVNLSFKDFISAFFKNFSVEIKTSVYEKMICDFSDSLLTKILTQEVDEVDLNKLACSKQIQRIFEKVILE